jgi:oligoendopeptidase F
MTTQTVPTRGEIALAHTWNAESVFPNSNDWEAEFARVTAQIADLARFHGHLGDGPDTLASWLELSDQLHRRLGQLYVYASMSHEVDTANQEASARYDRTIGLAARAQAAGAFAEPELLAIGQATLLEWAGTEPRLAIYAQYFDQIERRRAHIRTAEVEELLGMLRDPFATATNIHGVMVDADLRFQPARDIAGAEYALAQGTITALLNHPDREVRRTAWESYADAHLAAKNAMASCLATGVKQQVFMARARRYPSALEASLAESHIPVAVFHNLIETFRRNLPTWHRYWRIRQRALGYDTLRVYDTRAPLATNPPRVPFEQAIEWISTGMQPLGAEYVEIMRKGALEQRWVDIYPNRSKRMGAFSSGVQGTHPFILMSYNDDIFSMSTLAHELGHSLHSYYAWQAQPQIYSDYSLFAAEVASNFNQALVRAHLLNSNSDPDFQIAVIEEAMANFHRYFFIMPTLARFELEIHQRVERGEALNADGLITLMADLFREGYGDAVTMDDQRVGITWGQFSTHLYSNFYVYQYATGLSGAHALAAGVLAGRPHAAENYLAFLKAGSSGYPLDTLRIAGVDLEQPEPVEQTFAVLAQLIDRLEQALAQR